MKKIHVRSVLSTVAFTFALSTFAVGGASATTNHPPAQPSVAKIHGNFNLTSSQNVKVIVELTEESIVEAKKKGKKQSKGNIKKARDEVKVKLASSSKEAKVKKEYDHVFAGFSAELPANEISKLASISGVRAVYPDVAYRTTEVKSRELTQEEFSPQMDKSSPYIGSHKAWQSGYTGKGVKVAVIDTGVDYTHPDLDQAFGDYKGWDFVDNDNDPQETPIGDPRGAETTHGTHVAGTVAANGQIKGVAPESTLLAYRVLGPGGSGSTENVVAAIDRAVEDGADIMNLSLGNSLNNPDWATSLALDRAMADGVVAVTSNGNSGPKNWTVGSPGTSREAISVGATQLPYKVYESTLQVGDVSYASSSVMGFPSDEDLLALNGQNLDFTFTGLGTTEDFVNKDVKDKVAVIQRGAIPFVEKVDNAKAAGAKAVVIFNNVDDAERPIPVIPGTSLPTLKLTKADGDKLAAALKSGNQSGSINSKFSQDIGETMADFSSRGPVLDTWMIKPDVSAPGVDIVSTVPTHDASNPHGYGSKQGTSMASPHVAGAAALVLQANPSWSVEDVKAALMNTADKLQDATGKVYPHNTQGAGSIRVVEAIEAKTLVTPGSHSFGTFYKDKGKQKAKQKFEVQNLSNKDKTYDVSVAFTNSPAGIDVKPMKNVKVKANKKEKVKLDIKVEASNLEPGYYEGVITLTDNKEVIEVPTILFVKEPDYPRVTLFDVTDNENGTYAFDVYLPGGAEELVFWVYDENLNYLGNAATYKNVENEFQTFTWNGELFGQPLSAGKYNLFAFAKKAGKEDYVYGGEIIVK
ncbi:S8 family serine peptidase [Metabacillus iocasae]|uniref:Minor extracellular serine protease Vpr n=1 Tax=Priestia iocasae TaxID=2291674 RepID=A0ABS2QSS4_9BACI|nr:S8 family serine peptidase [Metabacillus iocasae]MBM7702012.1 minor extracellular serine protease Vpr [Metabacillus iocasae]